MVDQWRSGLRRGLDGGAGRKPGSGDRRRAWRADDRAGGLRESSDKPARVESTGPPCVAVMFDIAQVGVGEFGTAQVGTAKVGIAEISSAEIGIAEVGLAEVGTAEVGLGANEV